MARQAEFHAVLKRHLLLAVPRPFEAEISIAQPPL